MEGITKCVDQFYGDNENYKNNILTLFKLKHRVINNIDEAVNLEEVERLAFSKLNLNTISYYMSGAGDEITLQRNKNIFKKIFLLPRVLRDVTLTDPSTTVLGTKIAFPVMIAPTALHKLCHPDGEVATAKAAKDAGSLICLSSISSSTLQEVAKGSDTGARWFQLYVKTDRNMTKKAVLFAEKYGYTAIVVTVDAPILGYRERDFMIKFTIPKDISYKDVTTEKKEENKEHEKKTAPKSEIFSFFGSNMEMGLTWDFIDWLRSITKLKIILKGVHRVDDALKAQEKGVDAIIVSDHGGRQLDTVPSTIEMLIPIAKALKKIPKNTMEIYVDGGVRRGTDVLKAIALGAKAVFIGRPSLWGLACAGEKGVKKVLDMIKNELMIAMKLAGCRTVDDITEDLIAFKSKF